MKPNGEIFEVSPINNRESPNVKTPLKLGDARRDQTTTLRPIDLDVSVACHA